MWLQHSSLDFQCPVGRRSYRLTPQATIAIVACNVHNLIVMPLVDVINVENKILKTFINAFFIFKNKKRI